MRFIKPYFGRGFDSLHLHYLRFVYFYIFIHTKKKLYKRLGNMKNISYLCIVIEIKVEANSNKTDYVTP